MDDEIVFEDIWGATVGYGDEHITVVRMSPEDEGQVFYTKDWDATLILTPKVKKPVAGWYMSRSELENPVDSYKAGTSTELAYYTEYEIESGIEPDESDVRVKVVPYDES